MWRSQHQSLLCTVYRLYRWKEAVRNQNYMLLWWRRGKVSSWGSLGVVLLLWYVGPTVGDWGSISPICIWSRVYYRVPDSALGLYLVRWDEGPLLCAVLVAVVYCPKLAVMNTVKSLCISGYHSLCITCYMLIYIPFIYKLSCELRRTALWCVSLLYSSTCNSVRCWRVG